MTLNEYLDSHEVASLFYVSTAAPAGIELTHDTKSHGDEYCDLHEVIAGNLSNDNLLELEGTVDSDGDWSWNGKGNVRDYRMNNFTAIRVYSV